MRAGLNAGFGLPLGQGLIRQLADLGVETVRQDVPEGDLSEIVGEWGGNPIRPIFLLHDIARNEPLLDLALPRLGPDSFDVEVFNEPPGLDHVSFEQYVAGVNAVHRDCRARGFAGRVIAGAQANLSASCLDWTRRAVPMFPPDVDIAYHRYSPAPQEWSKPWPPFVDREDELNELHLLADGRDLCCTEFGAHTATEQTGYLWWKRTYQLTDEQVHDYALDELRLLAAHDVVIACVFQLNDGPIDAATGQPADFYEARYGIRRTDAAQTWKPVARVFTEWRG